ncbi:hypothetical protein M406DRAFT_74653 [Cryphonectria parasitica EP155]|uniref:Uncharacterized protein n=1 Tax=Cryphonectria parasitica (strain ATCC 38755 / EP155) TaxID=660469 RepID=A0A9P4XVQ2_CRYP1|nr:uncharacterized protein M406DRAFT_74653 [Cryphonectria parasitica EP155]KAF3761711.1 hypothetical protein M406DRAFT_74653 [Cryphonectria parasitica EP155]
MSHDTPPRGIDVELQSLGSGSRFSQIPLSHPNPLSIGAEVYHAKEYQRKRTRCTIITIVTLAVLLLIATTAFGTLYGLQAGEAPAVQVLTTTASRTRVLTSVFTTAATSTKSTTHTEKETETSTTTTTQAAPSPITPPLNETSYCIPKGIYGGVELRDINSNYAVEITGEIQDAVRTGLDVGDQNYLALALRSIFECVTEIELRLIAACQSGYLRMFNGIACLGVNPEYSTTHPGVVIPTNTTTVIVVKTKTSTALPVMSLTATTTVEVLRTTTPVVWTTRKTTLPPLTGFGVPLREKWATQETFKTG